MDEQTEVWAKKSIDRNSLDSIETVMSADQNSVYKITTGNTTYFLKDGPKLMPEHDRLIWLDGKLPVPKVIDWRETKNGSHQLITSGIKGENLAELANKVDRTDLINWLAQTLHTIHSVDITDCPFGEKTEGAVFTHGDACLPNFLFENGQLQGIIDLGDSGINDRKVDLAAAVWSLNLNCGPGYGVPFLKAYGIDSPTEEYAAELADYYYNEYTDVIERQ